MKRINKETNMEKKKIINFFSNAKLRKNKKKTVEKLSE